MSGRGVCVIVTLVTAVGCVGRPFNDRGYQGSSTGGTSGWVDVGGAGGGGSGGGAGDLPTCRVPDPQSRDASVLPQEIDVTWCDAAHSCATCDWHFPGVGIFVDGKPTASCTIPIFDCPTKPGGAAVVGGGESCPVTVAGTAYSQGSITFDDTGSPYDCQGWAAADAAGFHLASCRLGGFTCATSCSGCP